MQSSTRWTASRSRPGISLKSLTRREYDRGMGERSQRRLTAAARRAQLIDVGRAVFAKRGYDATSVEDIAEHAKISKPIIYEHFGG